MYSIGSILGPLLVFGGIGIILDRYFKTSPWALLICVFISFIVTNILLFKKVKKLNEMMLFHSPKDKEDKKIEPLNN